MAPPRFLHLCFWRLMIFLPCTLGMPTSFSFSELRGVYCGPRCWPGFWKESWASHTVPVVDTRNTIWRGGSEGSVLHDINSVSPIFARNCLWCLLFSNLAALRRPRTERWLWMFPDWRAGKRFRSGFYFIKTSSGLKYIETSKPGFILF